MASESNKYNVLSEFPPGSRFASVLRMCFHDFLLRSKVSNQADIARILVFHSQNGYRHIGQIEISEPLRRKICDEFHKRFGKKIGGKSQFLIKIH
mgnify:CR=1 FL=1